MGDGNAVRKLNRTQAFLSSFGQEADLNTSSSSLAAVAQRTLLTILALLWLLTAPGGSEGRDNRWGR
jgi:hypothetical protein